MFLGQKSFRLGCGKYCSLRLGYLNTLFMTTDFANQQKFKNLLNAKTIALSWFGSDGDLELFKAFISELEWTTKTGVKAMGI